MKNFLVAVGLSAGCAATQISDIPQTADLAQAQSFQRLDKFHSINIAISSGCKRLIEDGTTIENPFAENSLNIFGRRGIDEDGGCSVTHTTTPDPEVKSTSIKETFAYIPPEQEIAAGVSAEALALHQVFSEHYGLQVTSVERSNAQDTETFVIQNVGTPQEQCSYVVRKPNLDSVHVPMPCKDVRTLLKAVRRKWMLIFKKASEDLELSKEKTLNG